MMNKITAHRLAKYLTLFDRHINIFAGITHLKWSFQLIASAIKLPLILLLSMVAMLTISHADEAKIIRITNPEMNYGVHIGDKLTRKITIAVPSPYTIEVTAFPKKGTRANGIELVEVSVESESQKTNTLYSVLLSYQPFTSTKTPAVMQLPLETLSISGSEKTLSISIPAWRFWFSPLVVGDISMVEQNMKPQIKPPLVDINTTQTRLIAFFSLFLFGLLGLVYINADSRWLPFMGGAFAKAHRQLKRLARKSGQKTQSDEKKGLVYIHQAFNQVFGANIFARDINQFIASHPNFSKAKTEIEQFFNASNRSLYVIDENDSTQVITNLVRLSKQLRDCERGV